MANHERFLSIAKEVSLLSDFNQFKIGCVVVYKGTIISSAHNANKTHTMQSVFNKYREFEEGNFLDKVHAEVSALSKIRYLYIDWSKVYVYVFRQHKNGINALARPCKACYTLIKDMGIKTVIYSTENGYAVERIV